MNLAFKALCWLGSDSKPATLYQLWEDRNLPKKPETVVYYAGSDLIGINEHNSNQLHIYDIAGRRQVTTDNQH